MSDSAIKIRRVEVEAVVDLRHRILRAGLERSLAYFDGDNLADTIHIAAYQADRVVGCATVLVNQWEKERACQLRGMAVDAGLQKSGIGRLILDEAEKYADEKGLDLLWANCRGPAKGFYAKLGWETVSEEFEIPLAGPHFKMIKRLGK